MERHRRADRCRSARTAEPGTGHSACWRSRSRPQEIAGQPFNLNSPKQIQEVLFEKHKLPVLKKTPSGQPSTDEDVLQELALNYPLPKLILDYRSLSKLKSTYTDKLPRMVNPRTGRVHTNYAQAVAVTGRLSSNDPNLQNIPIRNAEGRRIREAFIAPPGHRIVSADYSQIELRIMAHLSAGREPDGCLRLGRGRASPHRRRRSSACARAGHQRAAALRQGHQLRTHLRHVRLRPGRAAGRRAQRRPAIHGPLLRCATRGSRSTCERTRESARATTATWRRCSAGACS